MATRNVHDGVVHVSAISRYMYWPPSKQRREDNDEQHNKETRKERKQTPADQNQRSTSSTSSRRRSPHVVGMMATLPPRQRTRTSFAAFLRKGWLE